MKSATAYILCTSPRSGSTLLCRMLEATGLCGVPESHFHGESVTAWLADHGLPVSGHAGEAEARQAAFAAAKAAGRGATAMFGLRLQKHSFDHFMEQLRLRHPSVGSDLAVLEAEFGPMRFVYLSRDSKLDQAISHLKAEQSGLWHRAPDGREIERLSPPRPLSYDHAAIAALIDRFEGYDRDWTAWFAREGISPLHLRYEALAGQPQAELANVLRYLDIAPAIAEQVVPLTAPLADEVSRYWVARYRSETAG